MNFYDFLTTFWMTNVTSPMVCGAVIPGSNGLYGEPETVYRNMAHWMLICNEISALDSSAADFIDSSIKTYQQDFSNEGPYKARDSKKDLSNGLIGTAWIAEGLCELDNLTIKQSSIISNLSRKLLKFYPFDTELGVWSKIVEPNGELGGIDRTFNHQLWMAASHVRISLDENDSILKERVLLFIKHIPKLLKVTSLGTVYHTLGIYPHFERTFVKRIIKPAYRKDMQVKEYGYHAFNLLGLVRVLKYVKNDLLHNKLIELMKVCDSTKFWEMQRGNIYGTHYNPVGIEVAVARDYLGYSRESVCDALNFHFSECFSSKEFCFQSDFDNATLNARLYEMKYLTQETKDKLIFNRENNRWSCK